MSESVLTRAAAEKIDASLRRALAEIDEALEVINAEVDVDLAAPIRRSIGEALATLGFDILEKHVYSHYADLRPYKLG